MNPRAKEALLKRWPWLAGILTVASLVGVENMVGAPLSGPVVQRAIGKAVTTAVTPLFEQADQNLKKRLGELEDRLEDVEDRCRERPRRYR